MVVVEAKEIDPGFRAVTTQRGPEEDEAVIVQELVTDPACDTSEANGTLSLEDILLRHGYGRLGRRRPDPGAPEVACVSRGTPRSPWVHPSRSWPCSRHFGHLPLSPCAAGSRAHTRPALATRAVSSSLARRSRA